MAEITQDLLRDLEQRIDEAMLCDRHGLRRQLRALREGKQRRRPNPHRVQQKLERSTALRQQRAANVPRVNYDEELPITLRRKEIAEAIRDNQVVVVCGETGSGKSTQLPLICLEMGRGIDGMIGHTQPRRIAARSLAGRIAEEMNTSVGGDVGFKIRFADKTNPQTYVKLMTDGILLAETQSDRFLEQYDTIILDEAHERSLNIDFLLGYIKRLLPKRPELRLIVTSATIDAQRFAAHFGPPDERAPVIEVSGRTYPVEVRWRPLEEEDEEDADQALLAAVDELARIDQGDMLIFMPTERHIREAAKQLRGHAIPGDSPGKPTEILPLYGRLSAAEQHRVFEPHNRRRIVIATNVAESSLTVPGIRYVIDTGTARISRYAPRSKVQRLPIEPVSQASADQRKGRCGRIGPGICLRLYSEEDYHGRDRFTSPEIQRTNLAAVILQTKVLRLGEIEDFPFLDPPKAANVRDGYKTLYELGALDEENRLTELGRRLARFPVDPRIARMILAAHEENCLHEVLIIAAVLELQDPRERPAEKQGSADAAHEKFADEQSDFLSYLKLWDFYRQQKEKLSWSKLRKACHQNFLHFNRMREWVDIHRQLLQLVRDAGLKPGPRRDDYEAIHRALLTGLLSNVAYRGETYEYTGAGGKSLYLWPGSGIFEKRPKWIVAAEHVETTKRYARTAARIDPAWIEMLGGHLVKRNYSDPHWSARRGCVMANEKVSLFGLPVVPKRRVTYTSIDRKLSRELMIRQGLVEGDFPTKARFLKHNQAVRGEVEKLEAKARRRDLFLGEQALYDFYDERIPGDVADAASLMKWLKTAEHEQPDILRIAPADLMVERAPGLDPRDFPDAIETGSLKLPLEYHFEPGEATDGIVASIPKEALNQLNRNQIGWLVPGLLEDKVLALLKSLPKAKRRNFIPAPDWAAKVSEAIPFGQGSLESAVATALSEMSGESISPSDFQREKIPPHLQMALRVLDEQGETLTYGRDLQEVRAELGVEAGEELSTLDESDWHRDGITSWDFGELPEEIELNRGGIAIQGYPALVDQQDAVGLRLLDDKLAARRQTERGVRRLYYLAEKRELRSQASWLPKFEQMALFAAPVLDAKAFRQQVAELICGRAFLPTGDVPRSQDAFEEGFHAGRERLSDAIQEVARLLRPLWEAFHEARLELESTTNPDMQYAADDVRAQLDALFAGNFLVDTPWEWLRHYPRYLQAIAKRLDKLKHGGLARDRKNDQELAPRLAAYRATAEEFRSRNAPSEELEQYRWMLEEFRVSLFAQELGTALPVSAKRLDKRWAKI